MEVVNYKGDIYLADITNSRESADSVSYDRTYAFYDYGKIKALDGKVITEKELDKYVVFTERVTGTKLPFKEVKDLPEVRVKVEVVKVMTVEVAKPKTIYTF